MIGMRAAEAIFKGGAGDGDDVVTVKRLAVGGVVNDRGFLAIPQ